MKKSVILTILVSALFMTASLVVSAQSNMSMDKKDKMDSKMVSDFDKEFADKAAMGGEAEIKWAELAIQKSKNKDVRNFASKMMKEHLKIGKELDKVAMKNNLTLPTTMSDEQMQMLNQLQQASETDFDKMYIQMAGIDAHHKMEQLLVDEASKGTNKNLVDFARETISPVQNHLEMAQELSAKLNKSMKMKSDK